MATLNVIRRWALRDQLSIREICKAYRPCSQHSEEVPALGSNGAAVLQAGELKQARPLRREAGHLARYRGHANAETAALFAAHPHNLVHWIHLYRCT